MILTFYSVEEYHKFTNKLSKWILNELRYILNKYKLDIDKFFEIMDEEEFRTYVIINFLGLLHHNEVKNEFYLEIKTRIGK